MTGRRRRLALVVQRYGSDVTGGSEALARAVAERLAAEDDVTVFTTCAADYVTWSNVYPEGPDVVNGVTVRRFAVDGTRDIEAFNRLSDDVFSRTPSREEELHWLREQGPYCPALVEALRSERDAFDARVFFTYLYYPTWAGLEAVPERSVLAPTAHDEPPLRLSIYEDLFARASALAFLTPPEEALVRSRFPVGDRPCVLAGMGIDAAPATDVEGFRRRHGLERPYLLYAGRIDAGKGCADLLDFYARYRAEAADPADLVLIGHVALERPQIEGVRILGFVPEEEKNAAIAGAWAVCCPSPYESLSIVLLEAFARGVPVVANARSAVLKDHCVRSNAGLFYEDRDEFAAILDRLRTDTDLRRAMGARGTAYVQREYAWPVVLSRYRRLVDAVAR